MDDPNLSQILSSKSEEESNLRSKVPHASLPGFELPQVLFGELGILRLVSQPRAIFCSGHPLGVDLVCFVVPGVGKRVAVRPAATATISLYASPSKK